MGKRGNGEGGITHLSDGRWQARITLEGGGRKAFYGATRAEAAAKLTAALRDRDKGLPIVAEKQTVENYLLNWLESVKPAIRPRTWQRYGELLTLHVVPTLGKTTLARLTAQQVQVLYGYKLGTGLSRTTVHHLHAVLHRALAQAERLGLVARNVCDLVEAPRTAEREMQVRKCVICWTWPTTIASQRFMCWPSALECGKVSCSRFAGVMWTSLPAASRCEPPCSARGSMD
jgi:integrase-like protein